MKKYSKLIIAAIIALIFIGTFVFLWQKSQPKEVVYNEFTPKMILSQIISESIVLTLVAGMSGILFGVMILQMLEMYNTEDGIVTAHFQVGFWTAIFAALVVSAMGVLAGLAPAARAMSIKPVDAMRDE